MVLGTEAELPAVDSSGQLQRQFFKYFFYAQSTTAVTSGQKRLQKKPEEVTSKKTEKGDKHPQHCVDIFQCFVVLLSTSSSRGDVKREEDEGRNGHRLTVTCLFGGIARYRSS